MKNRKLLLVLSFAATAVCLMADPATPPATPPAEDPLSTLTNGLLGFLPPAWRPVATLFMALYAPRVYRGMSNGLTIPQAVGAAIFGTNTPKAPQPEKPTA